MSYGHSFLHVNEYGLCCRTRLCFDWNLQVSAIRAWRSLVHPYYLYPEFVALELFKCRVVTITGSNTEADVTNETKDEG